MKKYNGYSNRETQYLAMHLQDVQEERLLVRLAVGSPNKEVFIKKLRRWLDTYRRATDDWMDRDGLNLFCEIRNGSKINWDEIADLYDEYKYGID